MQIARGYEGTRAPRFTGCWYQRIIVICTRSRWSRTIALVPLLNIVQNDPESLEAAGTSGQESSTRPPLQCMSAVHAWLSVISIYVVGHGALVSILAPFCPRHVLDPRRRGSDRRSGHEMDQSHGHPAFSATGLPGTWDCVTQYREYGDEECGPRGTWFRYDEPLDLADSLASRADNSLV